jgi:stalled ribosome rescue protein Dom34
MVQHVAREPVQQRGQEGSVRQDEADLLAVQLPFEDHELVTEREDLRVLGPVTHGKQPQHRRRVGHAEVGQSKKHSTASSRVSRRRWS